MGKLKKYFLAMFAVMMLAVILPVSVSASGTAPTKNTANIIMGEFDSPKIGWEVPKKWSNSFGITNGSNSHSKLTDVKFYVKSGDSFTEMAYGSTGKFEADKVYKIRFTIAANSGYYYDMSDSSKQIVKGTIDGNDAKYTVSSAGTTTVNGTEYTNKLYASYTFAKTPSGYIGYDIDVDYGEVTSENYYDVLGYSDGNKNYMVYDPDSDKLTLNKMVYDTEYYTNGIRVCPCSKRPQGTSSSEKINRTILTIELIGDNRIYLSDTANFSFFNSSGGADFTGSGALTLRGIKTEKTSPNYYTVFDGNGAKLKFHDNVVITVIAAMEKNSDTANAQIRAIDNNTAIYLYDKARLDLRADNNVLDDDYIIRTGYLSGVTIKDNAIFSADGFDLNGVKYIEYPKTSIGYIGHNASDAVVFSSGSIADAKYETQSYIRVVGKPSDTTFTSVVSGNGKVIVSWNKSTNASGYNLYRKVGSGSYSLIQKITSTSTLTFEDTNVNEKTQYTYQIKPYTYNTAYGINVDGDADTISAYYVKPNTVNSIISMTDGVTLTFDTNSNATGYKVYRDTDDGNFTCIATITDKSISSYTDTTAVDGYFYNYYVTSYYQVSEKTYEGICTNSYRARRFTTPTVNASAKSASSIGVTWSRNANATGYEISYSGDGVNETIKQSGTATSATITGLSLGKTYSIKVRAYHEEDGTTWSSNWSAAKSVTLAATVGSVTVEKSSYAYTGKQITPKVVAKDSAGNVISSNYYKVTYGTNKSIGKGTVRVVFKNGYSGTKDLEFKIVPTAVSISSVSNASSGIVIKWKKNSLATGYRIYRSIDGGSYSKIKTITSNSTVSYTDTEVKSNNGKKIVYRVYAYKTVSSKDYQSSYSSKTYYRLTSPTNMTATNTKTRSITVKWGKNTKATGYEVRYKLGSTTKTVKVTSASTVSKVIKSLTKGKTYTVDVRAYKTVSGTTYYSAWSTAKNVKISK